MTRIRHTVFIRGHFEYILPLADCHSENDVEADVKGVRNADTKVFNIGARSPDVKLKNLSSFPSL